MPLPEITPLPTPPNRNDADFADKANAWIGATPTLVTELNEYGEALADSNGVANYSAISTTSNAIGTGSKSFTVETGKRYVAGTFITIADAAAPTTNFMYGQVTSYNSLTGALVFDSQRVGGSGTKTAWVLSLSGPQGVGGDTLPSFAGNAYKVLALNAAASAPQWVDIGAFMQLAANYTLTSTTASQKLFNGTSNGTLTLAAGVHAIDMMLSLTTMSATIGNATANLLGAGTATISTASIHMTGSDSAGASGAVTTFGTGLTTSPSLGAMAAASTATSLFYHATGLITVSVAGTIIPSIALDTAAAAVVASGSYFRCTRLGAAPYQGSWT